MSLTLLLAFVCSSATMDNCSVWQEGAWTGAAAETYCTVERDLATVRLLPSQHIRYECETVDAEETAIVNSVSDFVETGSIAKTLEGAAQ